MPTAQIGNVIVNVQLNSQQFITQINNLNQQTQRSMQQMQRHVGNLDRAFLLLRRTFLSFFALSTATRAVKDIADYADAWKLATNQISAANSIASLQARSMANINNLAAETRSSLADTAELYARLLRSTEGVARSEQEVADVTKTVSMAFKAGGASMQEAANGARQLGQSLASGIFQGDELRSIRENAPLLAQAIATEFNTTIGGLKALGAEGKLTADRVFKAILENAKPIRDAFASTNSTIAESFTVLNNSISEYIGELDNATGTSKAFTKSILDLAKSLREASAAPQGTSAFANAQKDLNILWTAAAQKLSVLTGAYEKLSGRSTKFTDNTKEQLIALGAWTNPITAQMKMLELLRIAYEKASGAVETFVSTQRMTGRGSALARPQPEPLPKMPKTPEAIIGLQDELRDLKRLTAVAGEGADAYKELEDRIAAENETLKKYGTMGVKSEEAKAHLALALAIKAETRAREALQDARVIEFRAGGGRTGMGAAGPGVVSAFPAGGGRTGIPAGHFPTQEALDFDRALKTTSENWIRLRDAAQGGSKALELTRDVIEAENEALAAGHSRFTTRFNDAVAEIAYNKRIERSIDELTDAYEEMQHVQIEIDQQKTLQTALGQGARAFNDAQLHVEAFNRSLARGGDGTTEFEKGLADLYYQLLKSEQATETMTETFNEVPKLINSTLVSAIGTVSSAFADAVVEGENFRDMLDSLLKDLAKLAINSVMNLFLRQMLGNVAVAGQPGTGTGLLGGMGFHSGGIVGSEGKHRMIPSALVANAPRFHDGLMSNEFAAVLKKGEGVFTPDQMEALGGKTVNNFTVINQAPNTKVSEERRENSSGGMDVVATIRQVMTKEVSDPASSVHKSMKSTFGLSQAGIRR